MHSNVFEVIYNPSPISYFCFKDYIFYIDMIKKIQFATVSARLNALVGFIVSFGLVQYFLGALGDQRLRQLQSAPESGLANVLYSFD